MENKPKCNIDINGNKIWYLNGQYHREDGPAVEFINGDTEYWVCGKIHRFDGPAYIRHNGYTSWYINGFFVSDEITEWAKENNIDLDNLTKYDKLLIKLVWADYGQYH